MTSTQWKSKVSEYIEEKIAKLQSVNIYPRKKIILYAKCLKEALKDLGNKYVITPIDKTNGDVTLVCKRFYALTHFVWRT